MIFALKSFKTTTNKSMSQKRKALNKMNRIKQAIIALSATGFICLASYILRTSVMEGGAGVCCDTKNQVFINWCYFINIALIHYGEAVVLFKLLNSIKTINYSKKENGAIMESVDVKTNSSAIRTEISSEMVKISYEIDDNKDGSKSIPSVGIQQ